jgi:hypothetical protein
MANPQRKRPSATVIRRALSDRDPALRSVFLEVHKLVRETLPDVEFTIDLKDGTIGYGAHQYGADGWGIGAVTCHSRWVTLAFMRGARLRDPAKILEGTGKSVRHVKIRSRDQLAERRAAIGALLHAAVRQADE